ncbi:SMP-30/gluconolactonase/LRE family protein [Chloroflexota bacterium]
MNYEFELVAGAYGNATDGPVWDGEALLFTQVDEGNILRYDPESGKVTEFRRWLRRMKGLAFSANGTLYGCQTWSRRISRFNSDGSTSMLANKLDGHFHNQPDDLVVDRQGRIWFSDPYETVPQASQQVEGSLNHASVLQLERIGQEWFIKRMTYDTVAPTAVLLSQDEGTFYVSENSYEKQGKRELRAYPIGEDGSLGPFTVLHTFGSDYLGIHRGIEGMCLDSEGNIIACAGWEQSGPGPMIYVFSPTGRVLESHPVPVDLPTNCAFGDAELRTLYVTTGGGHLYRVRNTGRQGSLLFPS